jgi:hypothetical protein
MRRKTITLPSGVTAVVRKLSYMDFLGADRIPAALTVAEGGQKADPEKALEFAATLGRISLTKACGAITQADGKRLRIVAKPFADLAEGEVAIEELDDADAAAIIGAVSELSGMTQEAGREAAPFPAGQEAPGAV